LTGARLLAAPVFAWLLSSPGSVPCWASAVLFGAVCLSDYLDGKLARRAGRASAHGRLLDSFADIAFILTALVTGWSLGIVPWWVPATIAICFGSYALDSWLLTRRWPGPTSLATRLGHWGGVANFAVVGLLAARASCCPVLVSPRALDLAFLAVPVYSLAAVMTRIGLRRAFCAPLAGPGVWRGQGCLEHRESPE